MSPVCSVYEIGFSVREYVFEEVNRQEITENMDFVLVVPLYNVRPERSDENVQYDAFPTSDSMDIDEICAPLRNSSANRHVVCSNHQCNPSIKLEMHANFHLLLSHTRKPDL